MKAGFNLIDTSALADISMPLVLPSEIEAAFDVLDKMSAAGFDWELRKTALEAPGDPEEYECLFTRDGNQLRATADCLSLAVCKAAMQCTSLRAAATTSFSMNNADDRKQLIAALQEKGIPAHELITGEFQSVRVPLTPESDTEEFSIDAILDICPCQVGLSGYRFDVVGDDEDFIDCLSYDSCMAASLIEAVSAFEFLWDERESQVAKFREGIYDLPPEKSGVTLP